MLVAKNALDEARQAGANSIIGRALAVDDLVRGVANAVVDARLHFGRDRLADLFRIIANWECRNVGAGPGQQLRRQQLTKDITVDGSRAQPDRCNRWEKEIWRYRGSFLSRLRETAAALKRWLRRRS